MPSTETETGLAITARYDARGGFAIAREHRERCAKLFSHGQTVVLEAAQERGWKEHRFYFAQIADLFGTLPERLADAPFAQSPTTLRKHALIATGYCTIATLDAGSAAAALRAAAFIRALPREATDYVVVSVRGPIVTTAAADSQSSRAMGKARFQASKNDVLAWIEGLLVGEPA